MSELPKIKFNRHELAGSFGDIGTDFPLLTSMILICNLDPVSILVVFGAMQILTGIIYGMPMPVQPLKAMAVIMITQKLSGNILYGGGLAIGITMLVLTLTGLINWIANVVPKTVVRGIQFGLGLQLATLAMKEYVPSDGSGGYCLAAVSFLLIILLLGNKKFPAALFVIIAGVAYALFTKMDPGVWQRSIGFHLPNFRIPTWSDIATGFMVLTLPQLSLSLGNSVLATRQVIEDYFPHHRVSVRKIALTYSIMNLISPFFGGTPVCHGSGGMAGHYTFGARTGGSVIIYGCLYLILGLFLSNGFKEVIQVFPKPMLGVILIFEGLALMRLIQDVKHSKAELTLVFMIGLMAVGLPYGYVLGLVVGTILSGLLGKKIIKLEE